MTMMTTYEHGTFSWVELATPNSDAAKEFYGELFGWSFNDVPVGAGNTYTMCDLGSEPVAALMKIGDGTQGMPTMWSSYITVKDVDATAKTAAANGGTVVKEPFDVMDVGRMAVVKDPTGAMFCLWTPKKHIGAAIVQEPGALIWNELVTTDAGAAKKFYEATIEWTAEDTDMGTGTYTLWHRPGEEDNKGGMMPVSPETKGVSSHWLAYFGVTNCDASAKRATELGGKVLAPPTDIPDVGRFAVIQDPQGAEFAIFKAHA
jgi:predicted enzyme related to lactoylglutathione lyase